MDRYSVSFRIQSECGKIRARKTPNTDTFQTVVVFPRSEVIFECWSSLIGNIIANKIGLPESNVLDITDYTKKIVFIKLVDPVHGADSKQNLFKRH